MTHMHRLCVFIAIWMMLAACAVTPPQSAPSVTQLAPSVTPLAPTATQPACQPSPTQTSKNDFPEVRGTMHTQGEMWALLFFDQAYARQDAKIAWRITGTGQQFSARAQHTDGTIVLPIWGPEYHGGSSWERPGNEWGTGFNFSEPGCWTLTITRGATIGEIRLDVLAP